MRCPCQLWYGHTLLYTNFSSSVDIRFSSNCMFYLTLLWTGPGVKCSLTYAQMLMSRRGCLTWKVIGWTEFLFSNICINLRGWKPVNLPLAAQRKRFKRVLPFQSGWKQGSHSGVLFPENSHQNSEMELTNQACCVKWSQWLSWMTNTICSCWCARQEVEMKPRACTCLPVGDARAP